MLGLGSGLFLVAAASSATADSLNTKSNSGIGDTNSGKDGTNSRATNVSRDCDLSRRDLTKDWTRDGGEINAALIARGSRGHDRVTAVGTLPRHG